MNFPPLPVNHDVFSMIDTHQKAYLLGFLAADGCVLAARPGRYRARVNLKIKAVDQQVCRSLYELVGGCLRVVECGYRVLWEVNSDQLAADLITLGLTPRKSLTLALAWDRVPAHLHGAVLAGLIDGDGHLRLNRKQRRAEVSLLTASEALMRQLVEQFSFFRVSVIPPRGRARHTHYRLEVGNNRMQLWALVASVHVGLHVPILQRKGKVLEQIRGYLEEQDACDARMAQVPDLKAAGMTVQQIADAVGTSKRPVRERLQAQGIRSQKVVFTEADKEEMRRLHGEGLTVLQIHERIGKGTEQAVRFHLNRMGCVRKRSKLTEPHPQSEDILQRHQEGWTVVRIADVLNLCPRVVARVLKDAGVVLRAGSPKKLESEQVAWAAQVLGMGMTLKAVADALGVSDTLVRMRVRQFRESLEGEPERSEEGRDRGWIGNGVAEAEGGELDV